MDTGALKNCSWVATPPFGRNSGTSRNPPAISRNRSCFLRRSRSARRVPLVWRDRCRRPAGCRHPNATAYTTFVLEKFIGNLGSRLRGSVMPGAMLGNPVGDETACPDGVDQT